MAPLLQIVSALRTLAVPVPARSSAAQAATRNRFVATADAAALPAPSSADDALARSLGMRAQGGELIDILTVFPEYAHELRPTLDMVDALQAASLPAPARDPQAISSSRAAFLEAARGYRSQQQAESHVGLLATLAALFRQPVWRAVAAVVMVLFLLFGAGGTVLSVAANALPGDSIYPVKLAAERAQLAFTPDAARRADLQARFDQRRRDETMLVVGEGRKVEIQVPGVIESMLDGVWRIEGLSTPVLVRGDAQVIGRPAVGSEVFIVGVPDDAGNLIAHRVVVLGGGAEETPPTATPTATRATPTVVRVIAPLPPTPTKIPPSPTSTSPARLTPNSDHCYHADVHVDADADRDTDAKCHADRHAHTHDNADA